MSSALQDDLQQQMNRVRRVHEACGGKQLSSAKRSGDPFIRLKSEIVQGVADLEALCQKRDRGRVGSNTNKIKLRNDINKRVPRLKKDVKKLRKLAQAERDKGKKSKLKPDQIDKRFKLVADTQEQVNAVIALATGVDEPTRGAVDVDHLDLETGEIVSSSGTPRYMGGGERVAKEEELSEDHRLALAQMERNRQEEEKALDQIGSGVGRLKELAVGIGEELDVQNMQLEDLEKNVDNTQAHLDKINDRMKETLKMVNSKSDKFCTYLICLILLLGILTVLFNML